MKVDALTVCTCRPGVQIMTDAIIDARIEFLLGRIEELKDEIETLRADYVILFWETKCDHTCGGNCRCKDEYQGA